MATGLVIAAVFVTVFVVVIVVFTVVGNIWLAHVERTFQGRRDDDY